MKRVLLLNPPAEPPVSRDYYCGHFTKGRYYWPPLDLLVMSGRLAEQFDVQVLDAVVEKLTARQAHARIAAFNPDAVVAVTAAVSWSGDVAFLAELNAARSLPILVSGDYARAQPQTALSQTPCLDAVILDFTENDTGAFLSGERAPGLLNLYTRDDSGEPLIRGSGTFSYPLPRHELFPLRRYFMPQGLHHPAAPILTDFGCPFACDFCFMERVKHRLRDLQNVADELAALRALGVRELFLADQSFGARGAHARQVCETIRNVGEGHFSWAASMRVDAADPGLLQVMRAAGCHTLMFGVETPSQEVLDAHRKRTTTDGIQTAFELAREMGFRTLAHFIVGLTGEDEASLERLIDFAIALDPDIASFNVAAPAWNTSFGERVRQESWLLDDGVEIAGPDAAPVWEQPGLPRATVLAFRDRAVRRFYLRPRYLWGQLTGVRSIYQLQTLFREGMNMLCKR